MILKDYENLEFEILSKEYFEILISYEKER